MSRGAAGQPLSQQPLPVVLGRRAIPDAAQVRRHPRTLIQRPGTDLTVVLDELRDLGIQRVFVEGGPTVAASFLRAGLVDEDFTNREATRVLGAPFLAVRFWDMLCALKLGLPDECFAFGHQLERFEQHGGAARGLSGDLWRRRARGTR